MKKPTITRTMTFTIPYSPDFEPYEKDGYTTFKQGLYIWDMMNAITDGNAQSIAVILEQFGHTEPKISVLDRIQVANWIHENIHYNVGQTLISILQAVNGATYSKWHKDELQKLYNSPCKVVRDEVRNEIAPFEHDYKTGKRSVNELYNRINHLKQIEESWREEVLTEAQRTSLAKMCYKATGTNISNAVLAEIKRDEYDGLRKAFRREIVLNKRAEKADLQRTIEEQIRNSIAADTSFGHENTNGILDENQMPWEYSGTYITREDAENDITKNMWRTLEGFEDEKPLTTEESEYLEEEKKYLDYSLIEQGFHLE